MHSQRLNYDFRFFPTHTRTILDLLLSFVRVYITTRLAINFMHTVAADTNTLSLNIPSPLER